MSAETADRDLLASRIREGRLRLVPNSDGGQDIALVIDGGWVCAPDDDYLEMWRNLARSFVAANPQTNHQSKINNSTRKETHEHRRR